MAYNNSTLARLQAMKDITAELAKEGKVYIDVSLKALQAFEGFEMDFYAPVRKSDIVRGINGKYPKRVSSWPIR